MEIIEFVSQKLLVVVTKGDLYKGEEVLGMKIVGSKLLVTTETATHSFLVEGGEYVKYSSGTHGMLILPNPSSN